MKIVFATNNKHKTEEVSSMLPTSIQLLNLADIDCHEDIPETADTLEGNALQKARYVYTKFGVNCFADDTGLEVIALNGEPGVYSARYAGAQRSSLDNMQKLLTNLNGKTNREAQFRTVIALILDGKEYLFEGIVKGLITTEMNGKNGFGYDPIFIPEGYDKTFAELSSEIKNTISHRAKSVQKLVDFLKQY